MTLKHASYYSVSLDKNLLTKKIALKICSQSDLCYYLYYSLSDWVKFEDKIDCLPKRLSSQLSYQADDEVLWQGHGLQDLKLCLHTLYYNILYHYIMHIYP